MLFQRYLFIVLCALPVTLLKDIRDIGSGTSPFKHFLWTTADTLQTDW